MEIFDLEKIFEDLGFSEVYPALKRLCITCIYEDSDFSKKAKDCLGYLFNNAVRKCYVEDNSILLKIRAGSGVSAGIYKLCNLDDYLADKECHPFDLDAD